ALRHEPAGKADRGVHVPGAARRAHADAAHRFDAAGDDDVVRALHDLGGTEIDGVEARRAEARNLHAGRLVVIAGLEGGRARDDGTRFADRIDAAEDDV